MLCAICCHIHLFVHTATFDGCCTLSLLEEKGAGNSCLCGAMSLGARVCGEGGESRRVADCYFTLVNVIWSAEFCRDMALGGDRGK